MKAKSLVQIWRQIAQLEEDVGVLNSIVNTDTPIRHETAIQSLADRLGKIEERLKMDAASVRASESKRLVKRRAKYAGKVAANPKAAHHGAKLTP
jgi:hypothetical protein